MLDTLTNEYGLADYPSPVLAGCSAGGLAVYLHCDEFASYISGLGKEAKVQCVADAGYFPDLPNLAGYSFIRGMY